MKNQALIFFERYGKIKMSSAAIFVRCLKGLNKCLVPDATVKLLQAQDCASNSN